MPRIHRVFPPGVAQHVINRGNKRATIFRKDGDYKAFLRLMAEAQQRYPLKMLSYCLMPNHFHFEVWPDTESEIPAYMQWLMNAHVRQYQGHYDIVGTGHIYQGRYKNFAIQTDHHLLTVRRYVEANPLRACLVRRAESWRWSSLSDDASVDRPELCEGPVPRFAEWTRWVNEALSKDHLKALRYSVKRGAPFGDEAWTQEVAAQYELDFTLQPRGRPPKESGTPTISQNCNTGVSHFEKC